MMLSNMNRECPSYMYIYCSSTLSVFAVHCMVACIFDYTAVCLQCVSILAIHIYQIEASLK